MLAIVAPTDTNVDDVRDLYEQLYDAGAALTVASETHGPAYSVDRDSVDPDLLLIEADASRFDALVLVGGPGAERLAIDPLVRDIAQRFAIERKPVVAIGEAAGVARAAHLDDAARVQDGVEAAILVVAALKSESTD